MEEEQRLPQSTIYYRNNAEHLAFKRKLCYHKNKYGIKDEQLCMEFIKNRKIYINLMKNMDKINFELLDYIIKNKLKI